MNKSASVCSKAANHSLDIPNIRMTHIYNFSRTWPFCCNRVELSIAHSLPVCSLLWSYCSRVRLELSFLSVTHGLWCLSLSAVNESHSRIKPSAQPAETANVALRKPVMNKQVRLNHERDCGMNCQLCLYESSPWCCIVELLFIFFFSIFFLFLLFFLQCCQENVH